MKIELGITEKRPDYGCSNASEPATPGGKCKEVTSYPTMYIRSEKAIELPEGEFMFMARGKVISRTERTDSKGDDEPTESCSYDIEVYSIDPKGGSDKDADVGAALRTAAKKKMDEKSKEY